MDNKPSLDPVEVARLLVGLFLSHQVAAVVGPYAVIILAAMGGAAFKIANRAPATWFRTTVFFFAATVIGTLAAVPFALFVSSWNEKLEAQWLFVPAAAWLAYVTDRMPEVANGAFDAVKSVIRNWANKDRKDDQ